MNNSDVIIYTDGSSRGNPGPGGYGIVMEHCKSGYVKEYSKGFKLTTNNRMELLAVNEALKKLKQTNLKIIVYTDSKYVVDSVEKKWLFKWEKLNFKNKKNSIKIYWIKGHNDHPQNERCDKLAFNAASRENLFSDTGYENNNLNTLF